MRSAECAVLGNFTDEVTLLGVAGQITLGILDLDLPCDIRDIIADVKNLAETDRVRWNLIGMLAFDLIGLIPVIGALKYSAEAAESVASGEKMLKESQTVYESFADMMSPDDAAKYLDFLENGSKDGLTGAGLVGTEKADALLVSQKVKYEDVWDLRNAGDVLESGSKGGTKTDIMDEVFEGNGVYSGKLEKVNSPDVNADMLAERIGGESRIKFTNDPKAREFDAISDEYIAQAKPALNTLNKSVREQMKATFEAAKQTEKRVYYQFEGTPAQPVIDKLYEYSERYGIEVIIDTNPLN